MTAAEDARAYCMAQPGATAADCEALVRAHSVDGVYCDGTIVLSADAPPRCVPRSVIARKLAAEQATPLADAPASTSTSSPTRSRVIAWTIALGVVGALAFVALRSEK